MYHNKKRLRNNHESYKKSNIKTNEVRRIEDECNFSR